MGLIKNTDNERYMLFRSINKNPKNWEYTHFISDMTKLYREYLNFKGGWLLFRIHNQDDFTRFIEERIWIKQDVKSVVDG